MNFSNRAAASVIRVERTKERGAKKKESNENSEEEESRRARLHYADDGFPNSAIGKER